MLSVVIPAYNEEDLIEKVASVIGGILEEASIPYELVFVDDGSKDSTWKMIQKTSRESANVRGVHFSRNFGKESAMLAGLTEAQGDCCAVIDCDLQHPPEKLTEMYRLWEQGYEVIEGRKTSRGEESSAHAKGVHLFYKTLSKATGYEMEDASDFKLLDRRVVDVLTGLREHDGFFRALSSWVGFESATVTFDVRERESGVSKWSTKSLLKYAVNNVTSFTAKPMRFASKIGLVMVLVSIILFLVSLVRTIAGASFAFPWVLIVLLFTGGIIIINLGIIGFYIGRVYEEVKDRPRYIISGTCGYEKSDENE